MFDSGDLATMTVALIAAFGAYMAHRTSSRATVVSTRTSAEEQAFVRARKFDTETIDRQDKEIEELRTQNRLQADELNLLRPLVEEVRFLRARVSRLEKALSHHEQEPPNDEHDRHVPLPEG